MKTRVFFDSHAVFRQEEFTLFMQEQGLNRAASWRQSLNYHHKSGTLIHLRRFLYAVKPISINEKDFWIDPFIIAAKATKDSILAYHTALEFHGLAYTTFEELIYFSNTPSKPFTYQGQRFRAVTVPKKLMTKKQKDYGVEIIQRQGIKIKITCLERTLVDLLDRPDVGGGWEEIFRSFEHVTHFNSEKLVLYALLLGNATTIAKVGFFLEHRLSHLAVEKHVIDRLLPFIPKQPHYMNREQRGKGKYFEKWKLIVPLEITEKKWEEEDVEDI